MCTCLLVATDDAECGTSICVCERKGEDFKTTFLRCTVFPTLFLLLTSVSPLFSSHCLCILFTPLPPSLHTPPPFSTHPTPSFPRTLPSSLCLNLLACRILNVHSCEQEGFQLLTTMLKVHMLLQRHIAVSYITCSPCVHTNCPETSQLRAVNSLQWCPKAS